MGKEREGMIMKKSSQSLESVVLECKVHSPHHTSGAVILTGLPQASFTESSVSVIYRCTKRPLSNHLLRGNLGRGGGGVKRNGRNEGVEGEKK